jgi:hypothetical protein
VLLNLQEQVRKDWEYNWSMLVDVSVNRLNSGRVQICVARPQATPTPVQTYASIEMAQGVLLDFGIDEQEVNSTMKLLPEIGPEGVLRFPAMDISQSLLERHSFKL